MSNPCFDLWVLLHFEKVSDQLASCEEVRQRMIGLLGGYGKQCCQSIALSREMVEAAAERAKSMDDGGQPILARTGTRVYQIVDVMIQRDAIRFDESPER